MSLTKKRYIVLDALRGFAILGIIFANFPEFSLWTFAYAASHTAGDRVLQALVTFFVDGKFYTLFSLLFGVGFAIQIDNAGGKLRTFYRRMAVLLVIGLLHLLFLWSGDILMLYAAMGMILPLFRKLPARTLFTLAAFFLALPVLADAILGTRLADPLEAEQWRICGLYGITEANFATWLADASSYREVFQFLQQGAVERMWEFVISHRYFKVLGLFLIGYTAGRERFFANLEDYKPLFKKILGVGFGMGLPIGLLYTWSAMNGHPLGRVPHSIFYLLSVYPMGLAYASALFLLYLKHEEGRCWKILTAPGRMACTNYLFQSVFGILIFYGIGLGLGAQVSLLETELIALGVYTFQTVFSMLWMRFFRYGPVEWIWRVLSYGKWLEIKAPKPVE